MAPTSQTRVKICCISSVAEGRLAIHYGAAALGLVSEMPSGPGVISERLIGEIAGTVPPGVASFLLTCRQSVAAIIDQQRRVRVNTVQICDDLTGGTYEQLREALPGVSLVRVIHINGEESITEATGVAPFVDGILLDSGNRTSAVKELGGTGRRHDWQISRRIRESVGFRFIWRAACAQRTSLRPSKPSSHSGSMSAVGSARMGCSTKSSWQRSSKQCEQRPNSTLQRTRGSPRAAEGER